jgi:hypothetical protein
MLDCQGTAPKQGWRILALLLVMVPVDAGELPLISVSGMHSSSVSSGVGLRLDCGVIMLPLFTILPGQTISFRHAQAQFYLAACSINAGSPGHGLRHIPARYSWLFKLVCTWMQDGRRRRPPVLHGGGDRATAVCWLVMHAGAVPAALLAPALMLSVPLASACKGGPAQGLLFLCRTCSQVFRCHAPHDSQGRSWD